jgi:hypothetical protein
MTIIDPLVLMNHVIVTVQHAQDDDDRQTGLGVTASERWMLVREDRDGVWHAEEVCRCHGFYLVESKAASAGDVWIFGTSNCYFTWDMYVSATAAAVLRRGAELLRVTVKGSY